MTSPRAAAAETFAPHCAAAPVASTAWEQQLADLQAQVEQLRTELAALRERLDALR